MRLIVKMHVEYGADVNKDKAAELIEIAVRRAIQDGAWLHLPGSRFAPSKRITLSSITVEEG